jgi:hypothetical protein
MKRAVSIRPDDPRVEGAIIELRDLIQARYPEATFDVFHRDDPDGVRLRVTVDVEDTDAVMDLVVDKLYELQVEQELPVYVLPVQPRVRAAGQLRSARYAPH